MVWPDPGTLPRYFLLDEPTASLDLVHQQFVLAAVRRFVDAGNGALAVLHDLNLAAAFADVIVLLKDGRHAGSGTPGAVLTPERVEAVYGLPVEVFHHPTSNRPIVVPLTAPLPARAPHIAKTE